MAWYSQIDVQASIWPVEFGAHGETNFVEETHIDVPIDGEGCYVPNVPNIDPDGHSCCCFHRHRAS
eukprot:scaffold4247_cov66-Cylindrotheca_fusiformis.AAC.15